MFLELLKNIWIAVGDDDAPLGATLGVVIIVLSALLFFITSFTCTWLNLEPSLTNSQWLNLTFWVSSTLFLYPITATIIVTPLIIIEWTLKLIYNTMKNNVFKLGE